VELAGVVGDDGEGEQECGGVESADADETVVDVGVVDAVAAGEALDVVAAVVGAGLGGELSGQSLAIPLVESVRKGEGNAASAGGAEGAGGGGQVLAAAHILGVFGQRTCPESATLIVDHDKMHESAA
jgi:hypothetical protein